MTQGFCASSKSPAPPRAVGMSYSRWTRRPLSKMSCITAARQADGVAPVSRVKSTTSGMPKTAVSWGEPRVRK